MKIEITYRMFVRIAYEHGFIIHSYEDNFLDARWVCAWSVVSLWIGHRANDVPDRVRSYFLSPQQYEEYEKIIKNMGGSLR